MIRVEQRGPWASYYGVSLMEEQTVTDDIQKVREAHVAALREVYGEGVAAGNDFYAALAKRLQPRPEPVKKVWSVSDETAILWVKKWYGPMTQPSMVSILNAIAPDIIRERPDLVAAEWGRRYRERYPRAAPHMTEHRNELFPELDP